MIREKIMSEISRKFLFQKFTENEEYEKNMTQEYDYGEGEKYDDLKEYD